MLRAEKISPRACVADRCDGIEGKANEATLTSVDNHHDTVTHPHPPPPNLLRITFPAVVGLFSVTLVTLVGTCAGIPRRDGGRQPLCGLSSRFRSQWWEAYTFVKLVVQLQDEAAAERPATTAVLTPPLSLEGGLAAEHRPPNLLRRVLSLFGNVRPGSDLTQFQASALCAISMCKDSGLEADLCYYKSHVFLGFGGSSKSVRGKILHSKTLKTIYEIDGQWDRIVKLKDVHSGEVTVLYDAKKAISGLKTPILQAPQNMWPTESATVWSEVSQAILNKEWGKASAAKQNVEEKQRKLQRERKSSGELWVPKHFTVTHTKDNEWDCSPLEQSVPPAPIIVPP
ncbi:Oxysterol-binding protein [Musa troglodytarum]|uniref:Oxysterol-binding protein n=1 Tax=Musa troglodytarum TaxID=320322 RepID=A0A9E7L173_9LILI|nr:Oxysterol-binding protein [Musa troglodytarum]